MKKLILLTAALALCAVGAQAQGLFAVANGIPSVVTTNNGTTSGLASSTTSTKLELFYQPGSLPQPAPIVGAGGVINLGSWEAALGAANPYTFTSANGRFNAGNETTGTDVAPGGNAWLTIVGWTGGAASIGNATGLIGESTVWEAVSGPGGTTPPPSITAAAIAGTSFTTFALTSVPEPSVMILSGLGAAAMLLYRRKK